MDVDVFFVFCGLLEFALVNVLSRNETRQMIIMKNKTVTNSPEKSSGSNGQVGHKIFMKFLQYGTGNLPGITWQNSLKITESFHWFSIKILQRSPGIQVEVAT